MELTPKSRRETFLAAASGQDVTTPTPVTREEVFLDAIAKSGGGGGSSGGGALKINVTVTQSGNETTFTLDKTYKQIVDAVNGGIIPYICNADSSDGVIVVLKKYFLGGTGYVVEFDTGYSTTSENGYPSFTSGGK